MVDRPELTHKASGPGAGEGYGGKMPHLRSVGNSFVLIICPLWNLLSYAPGITHV